MRRSRGVLFRSRRVMGVVLAAVVVSGTASLTSGASTTQPRVVRTVTYSKIVNIPAPPASNFAGASGGGDGWGLALSATKLYNVFHHDSILQVNCHLQSTAAACWSSPKTITDGSGHNFASSAQPGLWLNQATRHLYVFATRTSDATAGVVCIDTTKSPSVADPFCGFTRLSAVGKAPLAGSISAISDPVVVGTSWYAFSFVNGSSSTGTRNKLLCFSLTTFKPCGKQPFGVSLGGTDVSGSFPSPSIAAIGTSIVVPIDVSGASGTVYKLLCISASTHARCTGSWPVHLGFSYPSNDGAPFPLKSKTGANTGLCLPTGTDQCYSLAGASVSTPSGLSSAVTATVGWNGPAVSIGPRVFVPNGNSDAVDCYDYATKAACTHFPKPLSNLGLLYTVNPDP